MRQNHQNSNSLNSSFQDSFVIKRSQSMEKIITQSRPSTGFMLNKKLSEFGANRHGLLTTGDKIRMILKKDFRSPLEVKQLYQEFGEFEFFRNFKDHNSELYDMDSILYLCKMLKLETLEANSIIYSQGDPFNDKIYIILSGKVKAVYKSTKSPVVKPRQVNLHGNENKILFQAARSAHRKMSSIETIKKITDNDQKSFISEKWHFGDREAANGENRLATTTTEGRCELLVIEQKDIMYVKKHFHKINWKALGFVQDHFPEMDKIHTKDLEHNLNLFEEVFLKDGEYITVEGEKNQYFYILESGECMVGKKWAREIESNTEFEIKAVQNFYQWSREQTEQVYFGKAKCGALIGEEVLFEEQTQYKFTVKVTTPKASAYRMDIGRFRSSFPEILESLKKFWVSKTKSYEDGHTKLMNSTLKEVYRHQRKLFFSQKVDSPDGSKSECSSPKMVGNFYVPKKGSPFYNPNSPSPVNRNRQLSLTQNFEDIPSVLDKSPKERSQNSQINLSLNLNESIDSPTLERKSSFHIKRSNFQMSPKSSPKILARKISLKSWIPETKITDLPLPTINNSISSSHMPDMLAALLSPTKLNLPSISSQKLKLTEKSMSIFEPLVRRRSNDVRGVGPTVKFLEARMG